MRLWVLDEGLLSALAPGQGNRPDGLTSNQIFPLLKETSMGQSTRPTQDAIVTSASELAQAIGAVSYLNTKPLIAGLLNDPGQHELTLDLPSRLADRLASGELDVALIPVIEAIQNPEYTIVSDTCIACRGPVWSVKLMSRVELSAIRTLALDEGSRTSQALTRILLANKFHVRPECEILRIEDDWKQTRCDAALIIGDRAMNADDDSFQAFDLGQEWFEWTGHPFVFAVWAARPTADHPALHRALNDSYEVGRSQLSELAVAATETYSLSEADAFRYIDHYIHYRLGNDEKRGMELYFQYAHELGLIASPTLGQPVKHTLKFYES